MLPFPIRPARVESRSKVIAKTMRFSLAVGTAVALLALSACAPHTDYFETRAFEITVDLTAEGQRMQITRTIECEPWRRRHAGVRPYTQWRPATKSFGERLPSGAAVMMVTPSFCRSAYRKPGMKGDELPVSPGHIPYIGWADNADNPTVVETYISPEYFERPDARVRYHGMTARLVPAGTVRSKADDTFSWFADGYTGQIRFGYYALVVSKKKWERFFSLPKKSESGNVPIRLQRSFALEFFKAFNEPRPFDRSLGEGLLIGPSPDRQSDELSINPDRLELLSEIRPLFKSDRGFEIRHGELGYLVSYSSNMPTRYGEVPSEFSFAVEGERVLLPATGSGPIAVYDPRNGTIFKINAHTVLFPSTGIQRLTIDS